MTLQFNKRQNVNLSKLKAFADDKNKRDSMTETCCRKGRKLWGKEKMQLTNSFYFSHHVFKSFSLGSLKIRIVW